MTDNSRTEWPMDFYLSAWKTFRQMSDENEATARHLLQRPLWPRGEGLVIADVGCGDGLLLERLLVDSPTQVQEVRILDPDKELLDEAKHTIAGTDLAPSIVPILGGAEDRFSECVQNAHAVLLVHVVYLMRNGAFVRVLGSCPLDTPLYVVLDAPHSVFTELWSQTAPSYHSRAVAAHATIQGLPEIAFSVSRTSFSSRIQNPLTLPRQDLRRAILSILTYSDMGSSATPEATQWVTDTLSRHSKGDYVFCESDCYEIVRHS